MHVLGVVTTAVTVAGLWAAVELCELPPQPPTSTAWALPGLPAPAVIRRADGIPIPALAASDLTAAVLAALGRDGGGFEAVHIVGDDDSGRCWSTAKARALLGWQPSRR